MRELTIVRTKSIVGCVGKLKVYIEDPAAAELIINNSPCRKLGDLKNGETKHFLIPSEACKIFVIAGKVSRNYCFDYYKLPAGEAPVTLTGKTGFNPAAGNAFRFDGVTDPQILADRKKGTKKGTGVLCAIAVVGFAIGFVLGRPLAELYMNLDGDGVFEKSGMQITLDRDFYPFYYQGMTACYASKDVVVFALKESFADYPQLEDLSTRDYAVAAIKANKLDTSAVVKNAKIGFEYEGLNTETNTMYHYYAVVYKTSDSFWLIQFAAEADKFESHEESIAKWVKSIKFE